MRSNVVVALSRFQPRYYLGVGSDDPAEPHNADDYHVLSRHDLPYTLELYDVSKTAVERVIAVASTSGIAFAAFYGARDVYPGRYIVLRHNRSFVASLNPPGA